MGDFGGFNSGGINVNDIFQMFGGGGGKFKINKITELIYQLDLEMIWVEWEDSQVLEDFLKEEVLVEAKKEEQEINIFPLNSDKLMIIYTCADFYQI